MRFDFANVTETPEEPTVILLTRKPLDSLS